MMTQDPEEAFVLQKEKVMCHEVDERGIQWTFHGLNGSTALVNYDCFSTEVNSKPGLFVTPTEVHIVEEKWDSFVEAA